MNTSARTLNMLIFCYLSFLFSIFFFFHFLFFFFIFHFFPFFHLPFYSLYKIKNKLQKTILYFWSSITYIIYINDKHIKLQNFHRIHKWQHIQHVLFSLLLNCKCQFTKKEINHRTIVVYSSTKKNSHHSFFQTFYWNVICIPVCRLYISLIQLPEMGQ